CVTGLSTRHVGERFQRSSETIARYFKKMLLFFASPPFYSSQVQFPTLNCPTPFSIQHDSRYKFFDNCIGAVDGTHIRAFTATEDHPYMRNRK
ncbi:hypothetical protein M405DRAFT_694383, partial [Rhizopogon salebrosus TDB-379]